METFAQAYLAPLDSVHERETIQTKGGIVVGDKPGCPVLDASVINSAKSSMAESSSSSVTFNVGERALCYHGPLIYEAKILKTQEFDASDTRTGAVGTHYFVHYKGWKQTYASQLFLDQPPTDLLYILFVDGMNSSLPIGC
jgi:hypothetical protein